jgi:putative aldouronate transport system substrate-binding protein
MYIIDMSPYEEYLQGVIDVFGKDEVEASKRNGALLGFYPRMERTHRYGMAMRTDILEECGFDPKTINGPIEDAYDKAAEIFAAVHEKYPDMMLMGGTYSSAPPANTQHTDALNDAYGVLDDYGSTWTVTNYYESEYFKTSCNYMKTWYDAGYIQKDMPTNQTDSYENLVRAGNTFGGCCPMKPDSDREKADQCNHDMTIFYWREDMITAYTGAGYSISGTAADPVQAARLLNYMFTSREFNDVINWGVEGVDWIENPDEPNQAMYPEGMTPENQTYHNSYGWAYPNQRIAHVWINNEPNMYTELYPAAEESSHKTIAYGFIFDNTEWIDTIAALNNIRDEYMYVTSCGAVADVEANINTLNEKLYASGLQELMDAKQAELDAWKAANGK